MKIHLKTFGCQMNQADSEVISGLLSANGFELVDFDNADTIIINSCGVKNTTQNRIISLIQNIKDKEVIVGGCLSRMLNLSKYNGNIKLFDTNSILKLPELLHGKTETKIFSCEKENRLNLPRVRKHKDIAIIPIAQGCLGACAFCSTRFARGNLKSYYRDDILKEAKKAVKAGCKLIHLTAQDTGCYGKDIGTSLPELLRETLAIEGDFKVKVGMMNPEHAKLCLDDLICAFKNEKIIKFIHIPVQSGSDKVLKQMGRKYDVGDFKAIVNSFRKVIPNICIATDIIVGYPSETEQDFEETVNLIKRIKPQVLNISKFGPRPKTFASKLKQLPSQEIKRRSRFLTKVYKEIKK